MNLPADVDRRRVIAGSCLMALAAVFLTNPLTELLVRARVASSLSIALSGFVVVLITPLLAGSAYGLTHLARERAHRLALAASAVTLLGWAAGARIMALGQLESLLDSSGSSVDGRMLVQLIEKSPAVFASIVPIGLLFPVGLILLGIALLVARPLGLFPGVMLVAGGILFPVGRALGNMPAFHATDLVLGTAFGVIGANILARPAIWAGAINDSESIPISASNERREADNALS